MSDDDGHHDYVVGKPAAIFDLGGTKYGYFGEDAVSTRDTTCPGCGEPTTTINPVDALGDVERAEFLTMGVCPDCLEEKLKDD
jgi:hypothetical protein